MVSSLPLVGTKGRTRGGSTPLRSPGRCPAAPTVAASMRRRASIPFAGGFTSLCGVCNYSDSNGVRVGIREKTLPLHENIVLEEDSFR